MTLLYLWIIPSLFFNSLDSGVIESYVQYFWREKMLAADGFPSLALIEIDPFFFFFFVRLRNNGLTWTDSRL